MTYNVGELVIVVDALPEAMVKNGEIYIVYSYECDNGFWYIGVENEKLKTHNRIRPTIFAPLLPAKEMMFSELNELVPITQN